MTRTVRGIRDTIPAGYVIGRLPSAGDGAPQLISIKELATASASSGGGAILPVASGGTGINGGTSGGVLGFIAPMTIASSTLLTQNAIILGGGAGALPSTPVGLGTTTTLLHGNAAGAPTWGAVVLTTDVSGKLPEANGGTNQSTYTLGDTLYASAANILSKLAGNIVNTRKFLRQTGTGSVSAAPTWDTILAADVPGSALTKTDDTNVTLTLGGSPTTALLSAASLTLGWTGQLALARGGTAASLTAANGGVVYSGAAALAINTPGSSGNWLQSAGAAAPSWTAPAALTKTDDTNVTLTLGGSATTALLNAASITAGWTGQLGLTRGGTAASLTASNGGIVYSTASALAILAGTATAGQILRSGASTTPAWSTATYPATAGTAANVLRSDGTNILSAALAAADLSNGTTGSGAVVLVTSGTLTTPKVTTTIGVGNATAAASGSGVSFPATQDASSDANTLDDYEEGTWTPALGGTTTYTLQTGNYTKIGRLVYIFGALAVNSLGSGSTTTISGAPFTSVNSGGANAGGTVAYFASLAVNVITPWAYLPNASTSIAIRSITTAGTTTSGDLAVFGNSARVDFSMTYHAAT